MKAMLFALCLLCMVSLAAVKVQNRAWEYTQPNGTVLSLLLSGDEFEHRIHDKANFTVVIDPITDYAVYAIPDGKGIKPSKYIVGNSDPSGLGIQPGLRVDSQFTAAKAEEHRQMLRENPNRAPSTGSINNIVIFIRFLDQSEYTEPVSTYETAFNSPTSPSMRGFFAEESGGQLSINTTFYPAPEGGIVRSFQDGHNRGYFSPWTSSNPIGYTSFSDGKERYRAMLRQAVLSTAYSIPSSLDLDGDNNGFVDNITFICQGDTDGKSDILWPHHSIYYPYMTLTLNGYFVWDYNLQLSEFIHPGVLSHEMSHSMGFPDLYHYYNELDVNAVGAWDVMESTSNPPQHHLTYMKYKYGGWMSSLPVIIPTNTPTEYSLTSIDMAPFSCYKIESSLPNEFYMLEYRRDTGTYESGVPASGLVVYRVISSMNGTALTGNSEGPPDEVYVYRPGVTPYLVDGYVDRANFSADSGRTEIYTGTDPSPWLYINETTTLPGNLVITDVGTSGMDTITFKVSNTAPNIWLGVGGSAWDVAVNWGLGNVPTADQDVVIKPGTPYEPVINSAATCKNITIKAGADLSIQAGSLSVAQDANNYGEVRLYSDTADLRVMGNLSIFSGSSTNVTSTNAEIYVQGDLTFHSGSTVNFTSGYLEFNGSRNTTLKCFTPTAINHMRVHKSSGYYCSISAENTAQLTINNSVYVYAGSTLYHSYSGTTILKGNLNLYGSGACAFISGTLSMEGSANAVLRFDSPGSYLYKLRIAKGGTGIVYLTTSNCVVNSDLTIQAGYFNCGAYTLKVGGNWINNVGTSAFIESTGTVIFNGTGNLSVSTESFNNLELSKTGIWTIPAGVAITCASYNWTSGSYTVTGGSFTASDLADDGIFGNITLSSGSISYTQDAAQYIDLHSSLIISGGTFSIAGGGGQMWLGYIDAATLNMSGGIMDIKNQSIFISTTYPFTDNISSGTIRTSGNFYNQRADFNPTGGTLELYGTGSCQLTMAVGSNLGSLLINKSTTAPNTVTCNGNLDINGNVTIQAGVLAAPAIIYVSGNWTNNVSPSSFTEGSGTVHFDGSSHQYCNKTEIFNTIVINKSGGAFRVNNLLAHVTCASYTWVAGAVDVLAGTITISDLGQDGIYGNFYANPGGMINLYQDSSHAIDLNGFFYNYGGTIRIYGGDLQCYPSHAADAGITMTAGTIDFINWGIVLMPSPYDLTWDIQGGTLALNGSIWDYRGNWVNTAGTVKLYGQGALDLILGNGSRLFNLTIDKLPSRSNIAKDAIRTELISAASNLNISGSLTITNGCFDLNGYTVTVANDLIVDGKLRMVSPAALNINDDTIWNGSAEVSAGTITCGGNWSFGTLSNAILSGSSVVMNSAYGCTLSNSSPTAAFGNLDIYGTDEEPQCDYISSNANSLKVLGLLKVRPTNTLNLNQNACTAGSLTVDAGALVNVGDGGSLTISNTLNLNGAIDVGPGSVLVHGVFNFPSSGALTISGGSFINDAPWLEMRSSVYLNGALDIAGGLLEISYNNLVLNAHAIRNFSNATLSCGRSFYATSAGAYLPVGGDLLLSGSGSAGLMVNNGNYLPALNLAKSSPDAYVYLNDSITVTGDIAITGGNLDLASYSLHSSGQVNVNAGLILEPGSALYMSANKAITVGSGGSLQASGNAEANALITRSGTSGYYALNVNSGASLAAVYTIFEYMDTNGVYIHSGATLAQPGGFDNCSFRSGAPGGRLLRIDNAQNLTLSGLSFPANTWGGAYNVSKTTSQGHISLINYSGTFAGAAFEQDANNRIEWQLNGIPPVQNLQISYQSTTGVQLSWQYPYTYSYFKVYASNTADGTFSEIGTSATLSWTGAASSPYMFYQVRAVAP